MPYDDAGKFYPKPFQPLTGSLFDLIPPDHPEEKEPATRAERDWYELVVKKTAELLVFVVDNVRKNYSRRAGVAFDNPTVRRMHALAAGIARLLDDEYSCTHIAKQVNKLAKQVGLVVYSTEPGPRENWPMASRDSFAHHEAAHIVHEAFWGRWPTVTAQEGAPCPR